MPPNRIAHLKEEPIISGAIVKAAIVLLAAGIIGAGSYALAGGNGIDVNLPDLPEVDTAGDGSEVALENTTVTEGELGGEETTQEPEGVEPFSTDGFATALTALRNEVGSGVELTRVTVNEFQTEFHVRRGERADGYAFSFESGELEPVDVQVVGTGSLAGSAFPLRSVRAGAVDRMVTAARRKSGAGDFVVSTLVLDKLLGDLHWTINAEGGGRFLTYRAGPDGRGLEDVGGGVQIPEAAQQARRLNDCIQRAGDDTDAVFQCFEEF